MTSTSSRLQAERQTVQAKLPDDTTLETVDGVVGWMYEVVSETGDKYTLFAFWDGSQYSVMMVFPDPGEVADAHTCHYFRANGVICLASTIGLPTLELAYAKSILFINAWSIYKATDKFVF